jgi:hypothetical protein
MNDISLCYILGFACCLSLKLFIEVVDRLKWYEKMSVLMMEHRGDAVTVYTRYP